ncbi:MAG: hypothetical protein AB2L11_08800 [Syntrophobacteraceae bacterium]
MKRFLVAVIAVVAVVAVAMPSFAVEVKYGGLYRARLQSNDNVRGGNDYIDDNGNWIDQRLHMYLTFVGSENLQVVTKWEADTLWGNETSGSSDAGAGGRGGGGDVGADAVNLEMKNAYIDFALPNTTSRALVGVQGVSVGPAGWVFNDDASAAVVKTKLDCYCLNLNVGYIAARNEDVTDSNDNVNDTFIDLQYASGPLKAGIAAFFQKSGEYPLTGNEDGRVGFDANSTVISTIDPGLVGNSTQAHGGATSSWGFEDTELSGLNILQIYADEFGFEGTKLADDQNFYDLALNLEYKLSSMSAYVNFIKNFGGFDTDLDIEDSYEGWMLDAGVNAYCGPWTFTLSGFYTSGGDVTDPDDFGKFFRYPEGGSHYWSEIMGLGTLDANVGEAHDGDRNNYQLGYSSGDRPSNLWTIQAGAAFQVTKCTKLTLNYWYIHTSEDVISEFGEDLDDFETDGEIGHELDFYLDQQIVDGLNLRLVAAYMFAGDAYTVFDDDDDVYETGAVLQWKF